MSEIVNIECDCGFSIDFPTALEPNQTLLGNAALEGTLLMQFDAIHSCASSERGVAQ